MVPKTVRKAEDSEKNIQFLTAYSFIVLAVLVVNYYLDETFYTIIIVSVVFALVDLAFAYHQPTVWRLVFKPINLFHLLWVVPVFAASAFVIYYFVDNMNSLFFDYDYLDYRFEDTSHPLLYSLIFMAVFPAVFEELAFRGFVFDAIEKISDYRFAIWGSSFLFALVHFSVLSFFWLVPFAIILARIRLRYSSIVFGIVAHFVHNSVVTIVDYYGWL